jgi:protein-arginine kinase activator protein McsA
VWNSALTGDVPKASTGTAKETASTDTVTDTEVLTNVIENFEQAKAIRDQLNALIDWYENNELIGK